MAYTHLQDLPPTFGPRNSDAATRLSPRCYTFPDSSVTCDPHDRGRVTEVQSPHLIVEVFSHTTEACDRGDKLSYYRAYTCTLGYVLIAAKRQAVQVYHRISLGWTANQMYGTDDMVQLASLDVTRTRYPPMRRVTGGGSLYKRFKAILRGLA